MKDVFKSIAIESATHHKLDPKLVCAVIEVESSWDTFAIRYEAHWTYFAKPKEFADHNNITDATEMILQKCSFGLMQVMGTVARELGFKENLLRLTDPNLGIFYGCKKLKAISEKYDTLGEIIAAYNAGVPTIVSSGLYRNQNYVDKVRKAMGVV